MAAAAAANGNAAFDDFMRKLKDRARQLFENDGNVSNKVDALVSFRHNGIVLVNLESNAAFDIGADDTFALALDYVSNVLASHGAIELDRDGVDRAPPGSTATDAAAADTALVAVPTTLAAKKKKKVCLLTARAASDAAIANYDAAVSRFAETVNAHLAAVERVKVCTDALKAAREVKGTPVVRKQQLNEDLKAAKLNVKNCCALERNAKNEVTAAEKAKETAMKKQKPLERLLRASIKEYKKAQSSVICALDTFDKVATKNYNAHLMKFFKQYHKLSGVKPRKNKTFAVCQQVFPIRALSPQQAALAQPHVPQIEGPPAPAPALPQELQIEGAPTTVAPTTVEDQQLMLVDGPSKRTRSQIGRAHV